MAQASVADFARAETQTVGQNDSSGGAGVSAAIAWSAFELIRIYGYAQPVRAEDNLYFAAVNANPCDAGSLLAPFSSVCPRTR